MIDIELQRTRSAMAESVTLPIATWLEVLDELESLRQVKPVKQEPVAWFTDDYKDDRSATTYDKKVAERWEVKGWPVYLLYAAPVRTKNLTDDEIAVIPNFDGFPLGKQKRIDFARAVIAKDREKNK